MTQAPVRDSIPTAATTDQVEAACLMLGIPFPDLMEMHWVGRRILVSYVRRDAAGRVFAAGDEIALRSATFPVKPVPTATRRAAARSRLRAARHAR